MQLMAHLLGGQVSRAARREYGQASLVITDVLDLFKEVPGQGRESALAAGSGGGAGAPEAHEEGLSREAPQAADAPAPHSYSCPAPGSYALRCWMSHGDTVDKPPEGFETIAHTANTPVAAMRHRDRKLYGVQFHPEVVHTPWGRQVIRNFVLGVCGASPNWTMGAFVPRVVQEIRTIVGEGRALAALSGGVDSTVAAVLAHEAVGDRLTCIFVDHGFLRKGEAEQVVDTCRRGFDMKVVHVDAEERFLKKLEGVRDPELKRKLIGREFIGVFEEEAEKAGEVHYLLQGTLYPDVIESGAGQASVIKSHHNVGGLPEVMALKLIEPLRYLFKDEVRLLGRELGLPEEIVNRQPFPGPGLAIRIMGDVTLEKLEILREADSITVEEIRKDGLDLELWQYFAVLLDTRTVGVMGDERTYAHVVAVRAVVGEDAMTADWARLPYPTLSRISNRIMNEVRGVNRVVYDVSSKPPSTIEWE
ncbi:MAG: glutamine-hydrolyzing GMP synthase [Firmicutes bacterium]|nr:glutamine-hydrolyzing GMP synthase [Bacillota bacterium]